MKNFPQLQVLFLNFLEENLFRSAPQNLYEPVNYILNLGGKRIRPILCLLACQIFDEEVEKALPAAYSIELFHNFSLVHDDIMDQAPLRRGQTTVHEKYGTNTGILSGDVMLVYVYDYLLRLGKELPIVPIIEVLNQTAIEVCEGQQYDMDFEDRRDVTIEEYLKMIELKTAVLLAAALKIGGLIGGASQEEVDHLYEFGRNIGLAFQLQDDILDTFGDPAKFGKKIGGDIAQNKKTFLFLKALEVAEPATRSELADLYYGTQIEELLKIARVTALFKALKVQDLSEKIKDSYTAKAFKHLAAIAAPEERKKPLKDLANQLMDREH